MVVIIVVNILDLFVVRDDSSVVSSVIFSGIMKSDHLAVVVNANLMTRETQVLNKTEEKRQWSKLDVAQFKAMLGERLGPINYKSVYDVNYLYDVYLIVCTTIIDKCYAPN